MEALVQVELMQKVPELVVHECMNPKFGSSLNHRLNTSHLCRKAKVSSTQRCELDQIRQLALLEWFEVVDGPKGESITCQNPDLQVLLEIFIMKLF